jgi:hypothetical protein
MDKMILILAAAATDEVSLLDAPAVLMFDTPLA